MVAANEPDDDPQLAGAHVQPLEGIERDRWDAARGAIGDFATALAARDEDGLTAALEQTRQIKIDYTAVLNAIRVPEDAGEWSDGLLRILRRIPDGWGRWIGCSKGWYPIVIALNDYLAEVDPGYEVHQVKEKFGELRYYFATSGCACCRRRPSRDQFDGGDADYASLIESHHNSEEHAVEVARQLEHAAAMHAAVQRACSLAAHTCEVTGGPGVMTVTDHGYLQTRDPLSLGDGVALVPLEPYWSDRDPPSNEELGRRIDSLTQELGHWTFMAERLLEALRKERSADQNGSA